MLRLVDIHCHILPGLDDGAADTAESLAMIRLALESGVRQIVATPHFTGDRQSVQRLGIIYERFRRLERSARRENLDIRLHPGAEVLCTPETAALAREQLLPTLGDTRYVLTEFYFDSPPEHMDALLGEIAAAGYIPVVAHPERYEAVQHAPKIVAAWFRRGYVIQLNKGSILGAFGYRAEKTAQWLLRAGLAHVVASDAHSPLRRTPDMSALLHRLREEYPYGYVQCLLYENPRRLIEGRPMAGEEELLTL